MLLVVSFWACADAYAIGGPAKTKRERREAASAAAAAPKPSAASGLREEIERSFLLEDFTSAEKLSRDYLAGDVGDADRREVEYLRALCFIKLRRPEKARPILEELSAGAKTAREKERLAAATAKTYPLTAPAPAFTPLRQTAVEEVPQFSVQVGSFSKQKNAQSLLHQLSESKYRAFIDTTLPALYRVRVGPLESREEAVRLETVLKKDGYPTKICP